MRHIDRVFLIELAQAKRSMGTRYCEVPSCTQTTREGKPYCPDHVDRSPYVQDVLSYLATQEDEQDIAKRESERLKAKPRAKLRDFVDLQGPTVKAILQQLDQHGARTMERLARETNTDTDVLDIFVRALIKANIVVLGQTNRGSTTVRLIKPASLTTAKSPHPTKKRRKRTPSPSNKHPT